MIGAYYVVSIEKIEKSGDLCDEGDAVGFGVVTRAHPNVKQVSLPNRRTTVEQLLFELNRSNDGGGVNVVDGGRA